MSAATIGAYYMARQTTQSPDPLNDRAQVRIFTVADYVAEEPSGKLYISGAGLEWVGLPAHHNVLPTFYLAIRLAFPIEIKRDTYAVEVRAVDTNDDPVGPDPLVKAEIRFDLDRVPLDARELSGNLPVQITDYPITVQPDAVIFLHLLVDSTLISQLPVQLWPVDS
jgi:hypothetical protein